MRGWPMNHRSLAELYEKRFAEQRREAATGRPPEPLPPPMADSLTRQIRDVDRLSRMGVLDHKDWLDEHVRAGNMQKCFDPAMGEHYVWIGPGPAPTANDVPADPVPRWTLELSDAEFDLIFPTLPASLQNPQRRKASLLAQTRDAVLSDPIGRAWRAGITDESFDRFCENEVDQFLKSLREGGAA